MQRAQVRTFKLSAPVQVADEEIEEIVFLEPTGFIQRRLAEIENHNDHLRKGGKLLDPFAETFRHVTGRDPFILDGIPLADAQAITKILAEVMGVSSDDEDDAAKA